MMAFRPRGLSVHKTLLTVLPLSCLLLGCLPVSDLAVDSAAGVSSDAAVTSAVSSFSVVLPIVATYVYA